MLAITASLFRSSYVRVLDRFGRIVVSWIFVSLPPVRATKMETSCQLRKHGYQWSVKPNVAVADPNAAGSNWDFPLILNANLFELKNTVKHQYELLGVLMSFQNSKYYLNDAVANC